MVGILGLGTRSSSSQDVRRSAFLNLPPPYREVEHSSPLIVAETTTTRTEVVTTTTTQTTHFFSLPLFRKRAPPPNTINGPVNQDRRHVADENGVILSQAATRRNLLVEKDLPPTPSEDSVSAGAGAYPTFGDIPEEGSSFIDERAPGPSSTASPISYGDPRQASNVSLPSSRSTTALAQAALQMGLPHGIPGSSVTSPRDANSIVFTPSSVSLSESWNIIPGLHHSKSSQSIRSRYADQVAEDGGKRSALTERPRNKSLLSSFTSTKAKEKGQDISANIDSGKTLSRRPSFWSRKKVDSTPASRQKRSTSTTSTSIPVRPLTHIDVHSQNQPSWIPQQSQHQHQQQQHTSPPLIRRHSERTRTSFAQKTASSPTTINHNNINPVQQSISSPPPQNFRRPRTADASSRFRARSFFGASSLSQPGASGGEDVEGSETPDSAPAPSSSPPSRQARRPRSFTNPPLLNRLSINFFSSSSSPASVTKTHSFFENNVSLPSAMADSPRQSTTKPLYEIPKPQTDEESPESYLDRLMLSVSKAEVSGILASSGDTFYVGALQAYIDRFDFVDDPLDVALRKLLMEVGLPRETQQIDRVVEAFANRYSQCNPNLFASSDHPYILAFSLIMLHTDAFNKSNKRKMTKADYVKNTRLPGVAPEVLDCFYDNIVFAPFIFIEDPLDVNGQHGLVPEGSTSRMPATGTQGASPVTTSTTLLGKTKIDPYYLITRGLLGPLRVDVESFITMENPYSYKGTLDHWDEDELLHAFAKATAIEMGSVDNNRVSTAFFGLNVGGMPSPLLGNPGMLPEILPATGELWTLRVTKVGLLNRKDDVLEGGKKPMGRKWKSWSVILTGSQFLLFRDSTWATTLLSQSESSGGQVLFPQFSLFKPDELLSVKDAIAVYDKSYTKYENTLRLVMPDGRHILWQASDEQELNEWISRINYASAFKSHGIRMRSLGLSGRDVQLTGVAAATSHLHDMQLQKRPLQPRVRTWDRDAPHELMNMLSGSVEVTRSNSSRRLTILNGRSDVDLETPAAPEIEGASQFKATFDEVKAELAASHWSLCDSPVSVDAPSRPQSDVVGAPTPTTDRSDSSRLPSRSEIIQSKVSDLDTKISAAQSQLDSDFRFVRNVMTLTPFQKATRDRLEDAVQSISKRITQVRLDVTKMMCHRDVLLTDLAAEERDFSRAKSLALQAATETLQSRHWSTVPRVVLSTDDAVDEPAQSRPTSRRPESSTCDSFHSALDFGPEWSLSTDELAALGFPGVPEETDRPPSTPAAEGRSIAFPDISSASSALALDGMTQSEQAPSIEEGDCPSHGRYSTAQDIAEEQAEEWNKTRAAKRVSLVRLPSDLRLSTRLGKSRRMPAEDSLVEGDAATFMTAAS